MATCNSEPNCRSINHPLCDTVYIHYIAVASLVALNLLSIVLLVLKLSVRCNMFQGTAQDPDVEHIVYYTADGQEHEYEEITEVKAAIQTTGASASQSIPAEFQGYEVPIHVLESLEN